MPLVPDASSGSSGVFSHRSTPLVTSGGERHIVVLEEHDAHASGQVLRRRVHFADQLLAGFIARMGLAAEDDVERAGVARQSRQPNEVMEHQVHALIGGGPARESNPQRAGSSSTPVRRATSPDKVALAVAVRGANLRHGNPDRVAQVVVVGAPVRQRAGRKARQTVQRSRSVRARRS